MPRQAGIMKDRIAQYLNEIVSITIMLLMAVALISAQADTGTDDTAADVDSFDVRIVRTSGD